MAQPRILMCPPDYYGIEYEINPWMSRSRGAVRDRAQRQWLTLFDALRSVGVQIELLDPQPGLPDLVFTANAGLVYRDQFFCSRFRHEVRQRETPHFKAWFAAHGFTVRDIPEGCYFEGAGDALFCGDILYAGYRIRSDVRGHMYIGEELGIKVLPVELVDPRFYHLDTCFCPLAPAECIWYPPAFDKYGQRVIEENIPRLMPVAESEALRFGCNAVVVGKHVILNTGCERLMSDLESWGYTPVAIELDEFIKAGGSAKCLTLRLDGEEAAGWKTHEV